MKYCKDTTCSHPVLKMFPQYLMKINDIIDEETDSNHRTMMSQPFSEEQGIQLDKIKNSSSLDLKNVKSMDMVLGIDDNGKKKVLLVDFKLNCGDPKNIDTSKCKNKIRWSKYLLFGGGIPMHDKTLFVFNNSFAKKNEAKNVLGRKLEGCGSEVMTVDELKHSLF